MQVQLREYVHLDPNEIIATIETLERRISERLPNRNLANLAAQLRTITARADERARSFRKPNLWLRSISGLLILGMIALAVFIATHLVFKNGSAWDVLEGIDAAISSTVFMGIAVAFLVSLDNRIKRRHALNAIQELRVLAHIIDMHQLAKDPERVLLKREFTESSPQANLTPFQLSRYLDYCSEMLSLIGKVAVIYVQGIQDAVVLEAVDEVESLTTGLSRKIWQKIMILDQIQAAVGTLGPNATAVAGGLSAPREC